MSIRFERNSPGIAAALSMPGVQALVNGKAQDIAARANAMASKPGHEEPAAHPAYDWHEGEGTDVAIANVSTASRHGRADNSVHHTLQKAGGI